MTIYQSENFYSNDKELYEISKNKELLVWLKKAVKKGYHLNIDTKNLQDLINNIAYWYETKYKEREMDYYEGIRYDDFNDMNSLKNYMDIQQLLFRLPSSQLNLLKCPYRSSGWKLMNYLYQ